MGTPDTNAGPAAAAAPKPGMHPTIRQILGQHNLEAVPLVKPKKRGEGYFPRVLDTLSTQEDSPMVLRTKKCLPESPGDPALSRRVQEQVALYNVKNAPIQLRPNPVQLHHAITFAVEHDLTKKKKAARAGRVCVA